MGKYEEHADKVARDDDLSQLKQLIRRALFHGDDGAYKRLAGYDTDADGRDAHAMRNLDWEGLFDQVEHEALIDSRNDRNKAFADAEGLFGSKLGKRHLDESFRDYDNLQEWVRAIQESDFFDNIAEADPEGGRQYLEEDNLNKIYTQVGESLGTKARRFPQGSSEQDRLLGRARRITSEKLGLDDADGERIVNGQPIGEGADGDFQLPDSVLANPNLQRFLQSAIQELGATDTASFFAALGIDLNRPRESDIQAREDKVREDNQLHASDLQNDQQNFQTTERVGTQNFQQRERLAEHAHDRDVLKKQGDIQKALTELENTGRTDVADIQAGSAREVANIQAGLTERIGGEGTTFDPKTGEIIFNPETLTESDLDRNLQLRQLLTQDSTNRFGVESETGRYIRDGLGVDANTGDVDYTGQPLQESDLDRLNAQTIARIGAQAQENVANTQSGRYGRKGVTINDDGKITIEPEFLQDRDLDRSLQAYIANINAGLVDERSGTEASAERDLRKMIAEIQAGQVKDVSNTVTAQNRKSAEEIARIQQGYTRRHDDTEREADRDLARDVAGAGITSPYGYAATGGSATDLARILAAQSTGGAHTSSGGARAFHQDQARIQASGGLSDPAQIAQIQTLEAADNPFSLVLHQLQQEQEAQRLLEADAQARGFTNRAAGAYGIVGDSNFLGSQDVRQSFNSGGTADSAIGRASEMLRQVQLANAAPQVRQQNIDLLSNPESLGAAISLGGSDWVRNLLGATGQFAGAQGGSGTKGESGARGGGILDPYSQDNDGLQEALALFNNPNVLSDGRQLFTRDTIGSFQEMGTVGQGLQTGAAAGAGITPDQLYRGLASNTVNSRENQRTSRFQVA